MPRLIVRSTPSHADSIVELTRLRTTIGRSARNDLCVEDPFASRLHAEIRRQGDHFWLSDTPEVIASTSWGNTVRRMVTWVRFKDRVTGREFYFWNTHFDHQVQPAREKSAVLLNERIAKVKAGLPLILLGGINRRDTIEQAMAEGFEFVAMGRALLREPDLVRKLASGAAREGLCVHCNKCMPTIYRGTHCVLVPQDEKRPARA